MKFTLLSIFMLFSIPVIGQRADLTVDFQLEETEGSLFIRLTDEDSKVIETTILPVHAERAQYTFQRLDIGKSYAVAVFQDLNGNEKMDTYLTKIPKEPYGFSNDVRGSFMGPPTLSDQLVKITGDQRISITVE
jgi:uncharacterized protein (DUF2141 family)